jgi:hypothetical protein
MTAECYRALVLREPFANLVSAGAKSIELRSWEPPGAYRGNLVIVAGRTVESHPGALAAAKGHKVTPDSPTGITLCLVDLVSVDQGRTGLLTRRDAKAACVRYPESLKEFMAFVGLFCWRLANSLPLKARAGARCAGHLSNSCDRSHRGVSQT